MSSLISIIIPIYNVEKYLVECLESVLNQTYTHFEVIMINDGSPDKCPQIAQSYTDKDSRFKLINQENMGLSEARNVGVKNATGKYILFIDSDDYITLDAIQLFIDKLNECGDVDIIQGYVKCINERSEDERLFATIPFFTDKKKIISGKDFMLKAMTHGDAIHSSILYLYKRELLLSLPSLFYKGLLMEDIECIPRVLYAAKSITQIKNQFYFYRIRHGSITDHINQKFIDDHIKAVALNFKFFLHESKATRKILGRYFIPSILFHFNRDIYPNKIIFDMYKKHIFSYSFVSNHIFYNLIIVFLGIRVYQKILRLRLLFNKTN